MRHLKIYRLAIAFCIAVASSSCVSSAEIMIPDNFGLDATRGVPKAFIEGALKTEGRKAVRGVFFDSEGKELTFEDFKGKVLVVVFWSHWSLDSLTLLSGIQKVKDYIALTDAKDMIEVLPISGHSDGATHSDIERIGAEHGLKMPLYLDRGGALFDYFEIRTVPLTLLVDKEGKIIYRVSGYIKWDSVAVVKQLTAIATGAGM